MCCLKKFFSRSSVAVVSVVTSTFFIISLFFVSTPLAFADTVVAPVLKTSKLKDGRIQIRWVLKKNSPRYSPVLELQRATGVSFQTIAQFEKPGNKPKYIDGISFNGNISYRARLITTRGNSDWSNVATIGSNTTTPPVVPPTTPPPTGGGTCSTSLPSGVSDCPAGIESQVLQIVNQERQKLGRGTLRLHSQLACSSRTHNLTQVARGSLTHDRMVEHIEQAGYTGWSALGQNSAYNYSSSAAGVMNLWMGSSGHRNNILNDRYRDLGVSCLRSASGRYFWVQDFGSK